MFYLSSEETISSSLAKYFWMLLISISLQLNHAGLTNKIFVSFEKTLQV